MWWDSFQKLHLISRDKHRPSQVPTCSSHCLTAQVSLELCHFLLLATSGSPPGTAASSKAQNISGISSFCLSRFSPLAGGFIFLTASCPGTCAAPPHGQTNTLTVTDTSPLSPSASWCYFLTRTLLSPPAWLPTLLFSTSSSLQRPCRRPQPTPELHTHSRGHSSPCSPALHTTFSTGVQPVSCTGLQRTRLPPSFIYGGYSQSPTRKQQWGSQRLINEACHVNLLLSLCPQPPSHVHLTSGCTSPARGAARGWGIASTGWGTTGRGGKEPRKTSTPSPPPTFISTCPYVGKQNPDLELGCETWCCYLDAHVWHLLKMKSDFNLHANF